MNYFSSNNKKIYIYTYILNKFKLSSAEKQVKKKKKAETPDTMQNNVPFILTSVIEIILFNFIIFSTNNKEQ